MKSSTQICFVYYFVVYCCTISSLSPVVKLTCFIYKSTIMHELERSVQDVVFKHHILLQSPSNHFASCQVDAEVEYLHKDGYAYSPALTEVAKLRECSLIICFVSCVRCYASWLDLNRPDFLLSIFLCECQSCKSLYLFLIQYFMHGLTRLMAQFLLMCLSNVQSQGCAQSVPFPTLKKLDSLNYVGTVFIFIIAVNLISSIVFIVTILIFSSFTKHKRNT